MKTILPAILLLTFFSAVAQEGWELRKDKNNIKVYIRKLEESDFHEFRGECEMEGSLSRVVAALRDIETYPDWMPNSSETQVLEETGDTAMVYYLVADAPWPVKDRDGIYRMGIRQLPEGEGLRIHLDCLPDYIPEKDDYVRIPRSDGFWLLKPVGEERVKVVYQLLVDPGGNVPAWLANATAVSQPFHSIEALRERIQLPKYDNQNFSFLP